MSSTSHCRYLGEPTGEVASARYDDERPVPLYRCLLFGVCVPFGKADASFSHCDDCLFNPHNREQGGGADGPDCA